MVPSCATQGSTRLTAAATPAAIQQQGREDVGPPQATGRRGVRGEPSSAGRRPPGPSPARRTARLGRPGRGAVARRSVARGRPLGRDLVALAHALPPASGSRGEPATDEPRTAAAGRGASRAHCRRARDDPGRQGDRGGDPHRTDRAGGGADRRRPPAGPRHAAGRRRPGQPLVRQRQAPRLRRGRHRQHPARAARRRPRRPTSLAVVAELNADPACTGYIVQLPLPRADRRVRASSRRWTRPRTPTGCTRSTSAGWCSTSPAPLPCTPVGIVELLRRYDVPIAGAEVVVVGRGITVGRPLGPAAHPPHRRTPR